MFQILAHQSPAHPLASVTLISEMEKVHCLGSCLLSLFNQALSTSNYCTGPWHNHKLSRVRWGAGLYVARALTAESRPPHWHVISPTVQLWGWKEACWSCQVQEAVKDGDCGSIRLWRLRQSSTFRIHAPEQTRKCVITWQQCQHTYFIQWFTSLLIAYWDGWSWQQEWWKTYCSEGSLRLSDITYIH